MPGNFANQSSKYISYILPGMISNNLQAYLFLLNRKIWKNNSWKTIMYLYQYIFRNCLSIQHPDNAVAISCIMLTMCYHDDGRTLFIQFR